MYLLQNLYRYYTLDRVLVVGSKENSTKVLSTLKNSNEFYLLKNEPVNEQKEVYELSKKANHIVITTSFEDKDQQYDVYNNLFSIKYGKSFFSSSDGSLDDYLSKSYKNDKKIHLFINNLNNKLLKSDYTYHFCLYRVQIHDMKINNILSDMDDLIKKMKTS